MYSQSADGKLGCWLFAAFIALVVLVLASAAQAEGPADLLAEHNRERKTRNLEPLHLDSRLNKAAQGHAEYCASRSRLSHYGPGRNTWADRARAAGYNADLFSCSENIAYGYVNSADVTGGWMRSLGHRRNVLGRWYHAGFGCAKAANGRLYWCAVYAMPASVVPQRPRPLFPLNPLPRWPRR